MLQGILVIGTYAIFVSSFLHLTKNVEIPHELLSEIHYLNS